jgi:hypothetical protein
MRSAVLGQIAEVKSQSVNVGAGLEILHLQSDLEFLNLQERFG